MMKSKSSQKRTFAEYTKSLLDRGLLDQKDVYDDQYDIDLSLNLMRARMANGMTQQELAVALGTQQPNIARFESGSFLPSHAMIKRIARILNIQPIAPSFEQTQVTVSTMSNQSDWTYSYQSTAGMTSTANQPVEYLMYA